MTIIPIKRKYIILIIVSFLISVGSIIPIRIAIARYQAPKPQAILTLGGSQGREVFTAEFATLHPYLPVWVSSGSKETIAREIFKSIGVNNRRVYIDRRATDTVTNFTTLVNDFKKQKIRHVYLITDDFHLPRSKAIALIVFGSRGITFTPISVETHKIPEPKIKIVRDVMRSLFWIATKHTGSTFDDKSRRIRSNVERRRINRRILRQGS